MLDAFLELLNGSTTAVKGECLDDVFSKKKAMQLLSFNLTSQKDLTGGSAPKPKPKEEDEDGDEDGDGEKKDKPKERKVSKPPIPKETDKPAQELFVFTITKEVDSGTPDLFLAFCKRWATQEVTWDKARVTLRKAAGGKPNLEYLIYEFTNVWVKSWNLDNQDGDDLPEEEVEFAFDTCKVNYYPQKHSAGGASMKYAGWDFGNNKEL